MSVAKYGGMAENGEQTECGVTPREPDDAAPSSKGRTVAGVCL